MFSSIRKINEFGFEIDKLHFILGKLVVIVFTVVVTSRSIIKTYLFTGTTREYRYQSTASTGERKSGPGRNLKAGPTNLFWWTKKKFKGKIQLNWTMANLFPYVLFHFLCLFKQGLWTKKEKKRATFQKNRTRYKYYSSCI